VCAAVGPRIPLNWRFHVIRLVQHYMYTSPSDFYRDSVTELLSVKSHTGRISRSSLVFF
jgi:hypothetical protein